MRSICNVSQGPHSHTASDERAYNILGACQGTYLVHKTQFYSYVILHWCGYKMGQGGSNTLRRS